MEFLPEGFINLYISESGICICHIHICTYISSVCFHVRYHEPIFFSCVCLCAFCVAKVDAPHQHDHHHHHDYDHHHKYRQHTHKQRSREGETRPRAQARASSRANGTHLPVWASFLFFVFCFFVFLFFIHFSISNEMWHLAEKVWPTWGALPTICSMSSLRSAAYSIVRRLQLQLVTQLLNGQEPQRVEWTRHIGLALIRFALPAAGGGGGGRRRGVGDVPAAMAAQTSGFVSFSRKYNTHTHTDKSLCQRDSNNPNKAKRLNSWSCFIWFQPQIHFSRRRFAVGCCCEQRALSAALAVNQIRWWFSACLWLQSHFPFLVPRSSFPIFHFSPNCTDATQQLQPSLRQRQRLRLWLRLRLRLTLRHSQASKVAQSFRPLHSVARALKNCQHSICVQSNVATNYEIYHKRIELHCSIITTFWYLLKYFEIFETNQRNNC